MEPVRVLDDYGGRASVSVGARGAKLVFLEAVDPDGLSLVTFSPAQTRQLVAALMHALTYLKEAPDAL